MLFYLFNILIITVVWLSKPPSFMKENIDYVAAKRKSICIIGTINWIILSGLRGLSIGPDTYAYKVYRFERTQFRSWSELFNDFTLKYIEKQSIKDPAYPVIEKTFQLFANNYQLFLIFIAIVFFIPFGILIYKKSYNPYISFVLFSCLFYSFFAITGHRQTIATALVVLLGIYLIESNKMFSFIILCFIASTIHASAICFLPFYWISKIRINKLTLTIYWVLIIISFVLRYFMLDILQSLVGYEQYKDNEGAQAGTFMFLLILLAIFTTIFYKKFDVIDNCFERMCINAIMVACVFSSSLLINQSFMRVVQYYSIFLIFVLPNCCKIFSKQRDRVLFNYICCLIMIALLVKRQPNYVFFWMDALNKL